MICYASHEALIDANERWFAIHFPKKEKRKVADELQDSETIALWY